MNYILFVSLLLSVFSPIAIDLYISLIPEITNEFQKDGELTLSVYFLGIGIGYLFMGNLYDRYGAHKMSTYNLLLFSLSSFGIYFSKNYELILLLRMIQGISISGICVTYLVLIKDNFKEKDTAKYYGYINSIMNVAPATLPFLGVYIFNTFSDWRYNFLLIGVFSLISLLIILKQTKKIPFKQHEEQSWSFLKDIKYKHYSPLAVLSLVMLFLYVSLSPNYFISNLGWSSYEFSIFFAINGLFLAAGGLIFSHIVKTKEIKNILFFSYLIVLFSGFLISLSEISYLFFITGIFIFSLIFPSIIASSTTLSLSNLNKDLGKAVSFISCLQMLISSLLTFIFIHFFENEIIILGVFIFINALYGSISLRKKI